MRERARARSGIYVSCGAAPLPGLSEGRIRGDALWRLGALADFFFFSWARVFLRPPLGSEVLRHALQFFFYFASRAKRTFACCCIAWTAGSCFVALIFFLLLFFVPRLFVFYSRTCPSSLRLSLFCSLPTSRARVTAICLAARKNK